VNGETGIQARWCTPSGAAAIAVLELRGAPQALSRALGATLPEIGALSLRELPGPDEGLLLRVAHDTLLVTPHGGPRVRQRISEALLARGAHFAHEDAADWSACTDDPVMRRVLALLPHVASDDALPLLLAQPERWKRFGAPGMGDAERGARLRRLIHAPTVAIVGAPNAGKSSLINALAGRELAAASPEAGTTRDYVSARVALAGLTCNLIDAPGTRDTDDPIESRAIAAARTTIAAADLRVALAAPDQAFPDAWPDALRVRTKIDLAPAHDAMGVSAQTGTGLAELARVIRERLVPAADLRLDRPFDFVGPTGP
jgi:hypothetical protein